MVDQKKDDFSEQQKTRAASGSTHAKTKSSSSLSRRSPLDFRKYTKQIWLAGLGAFSRAEEEGNKLFDALVKVGEELESSSEQGSELIASKTAEQKRAASSDKKDKVEKILDLGVHHSLHRIGLVTTKDLQYLENLILQLHQKVDLLTEENKQLHDVLHKNNLS